jgi:EmrB/QacA subfamily drug resistance transporter
MSERDTPGRPTPPSHGQVLQIIGGLAGGMLLAALDQTIVATALPTIVGELGGVDQLAWVVTAYLLATTASTPLWGKISDLHGRKRTFQTAIVVFTVGSALSGAAQSMPQLVGARLIQGAGGGGLMTLSFAIVGDVLSPRQRGRYIGYLGGVLAVASVAGPVVGGFFVDHLSWRWSFFVNVPIASASLIVTSRALRLVEERRHHRIDWAGAALLVASVTGTILLVESGQHRGWTSPPALAGIAATVALAAALVVVERRAAEPVLDPRLFRRPVFTISVSAAFLVGAAMFAVLTYVPVFLQIATSASATASGLLLLPLMVGVTVAATVSGRLITRTGRYKVFPLLGFLLSAAGTTLLALMDVGADRLHSTTAMAMVGLGIGCITQVLVLAVQNEAPARELGAVTSSVSFARSLGGSLGVAAYGTLFSARLTDLITDGVPATALAGLGDPLALVNTPDQVQQLPVTVREGLSDATAGAAATVFWWVVPLLLLGFVLVTRLRESPLREDAHVRIGDDRGGGSATLARTGTRRHHANVNTVVSYDDVHVVPHDEAAYASGYGSDDTEHRRAEVRGRFFIVDDEVHGVHFRAGHELIESRWSPRHRHTFDQVHLVLRGEESFDGLPRPAGTASYHPESVFYGPHVTGPGTEVLVVQLPGASRSYFGSNDDLKRAVAALREQGVELRDGIAVWPDGREQDSTEACWEWLLGAEVPYAPPRFDAPVQVHTPAMPWATTGLPGVSVKHVGYFTESGPNVMLVRLDPGASLPATTRRFAEARFVVEGAVSQRGEHLPAVSFLYYPPGVFRPELASAEGATCFVVQTASPGGPAPGREEL